MGVPFERATRAVAHPADMEALLVEDHLAQAVVDRHEAVRCGPGDRPRFLVDCELKPEMDLLERPLACVLQRRVGRSERAIDSGAAVDEHLADQLVLPAGPPTVDDTFFFTGSPADTVAYVVTFTAVNFGSGWHPHVRKLPGRSGSITMMSRLTDRFRTSGPLSAAVLAEATPALAAEVFHQPRTAPVDELLALFAQAWRDLGALLLAEHGGSFCALVEAAGHRAERLAELLCAMPLFRDVATYRGRPVPLLKRAQIAAADLHAALGDHPLGRFDDLDRLTIFADNLVPHVLRVDGVLRYPPQLARRIDAEQLLAPGSEEEIEIRAGAVWAVEQMVAHLHQRRQPATAAAVDLALWTRGQSPRYKAIPRHRCRTPYY